MAIAKSKRKLIAFKSEKERQLSLSRREITMEREIKKRARNYSKNEAKKIKSNNFTISNREKKNHFAFWVHQNYFCQLHIEVVNLLILKFIVYWNFSTF